MIRFRRPVPDFAAQTTMSFFCAVPPMLPSDREGVGAFPGSGPNYISEFIRDRRVVLERNRFYQGARPHHVDRFVVDLQGGTSADVLERVQRGEADWGLLEQPFYLDPAQKLVAKYGVNRSQFFVKPGLVLRGYYLNVSRGLFRDNLALRQAVNFAVDRPALVRRGGIGSPLGGRPTDQYLPATMPGFKDARLYPLTGPDLRKARALARGRTRSGKAVLWTMDIPTWLSAAQIVRRNLRQIGLDVEVKGLPPSALFLQAARAGARFDILLGLWIADYVDPYEFMSVLFDGSFVGTTNLARLDSPRHNATLRRASHLQGNARYRAYGQVDVQLARDVAPMIAVENGNWATLVSKRVGCLVLKPFIDLAAVCIK